MRVTERTNFCIIVLSASVTEAPMREDACWRQHLIVIDRETKMMEVKLSIILYVGFLLGFAPMCRCASNTSQIENQLETEFELRDPRSFLPTPQKDYLMVRMPGFNKISHYTADGTYLRTDPIANWERYALNYWFETRTPYSSCEMVPSGISAHTDWTLMIPCMFAADPHKPPNTIFVNTYMLPHFIESTLHFMDPTYRFVLVSGGADMTVPRGAGDSRYHLLRGFAQGWDGGAYYQMLLNDPRLIHWYCENHDLEHKKLSTLPTGLVDEIHDAAVRDMPTALIPFNKRPLKILVSDKVRTGTGQWATRANVARMCDALPEYCMRPSGDMANGISHEEFFKLVSSVPFIACAHGGGMDPSPKAWEAIMAGTIPIIQHSTLDDAYSKLPVAFVDNWEQLLAPANHTVLVDMLQGWITKLQPYYEEGSALRKKTLDKLKTSYWMEQIHKKVEEYHRLEALRHSPNNATISTGANSTSSNGTAAAGVEAVTTRSLLRKVDPVRPNTAKEHKPQDQVELARTVRALRAAAIAQAQQDGTWHVNPALGRDGKVSKTKRVSKDKSNVGRGSVEQSNSKNSQKGGQAKESVWWKWW